MDWWKRGLKELPLAAGIGAGLLWMWVFGSAFVLDGRMEGYGWSGYVMNAWSVHSRMVESYDAFRAPLHGWLLGMLGEAMGSYADGAILLSSLCVAAMVVAAGMAGRALVGSWIGGLAAAALPLTANATHASRWANSYPVLAATTGTSLAAALCLARWPHPVLGLLTGALCGLAWVADGRGLIVFPPALLLVGLAMTGARGARRWLIPAAVAVGVLTGPAVRTTTGWDQVDTLTVTEKLAIQRRVVHRWIHLSHNDALMAACGEVAEETLLTRAFFDTPCPPALVRYNLTERLPRHLPLGVLAALGVLVVLPGSRGRRGAGEGAAVLVAASGTIGLFSLTPMADRYLIQFAVLLAVLGPAGAGRLVQTVAPKRWWLCALAAVGMGAWAWQTDPPSRHAPTELQQNRDKALSEQVREAMHREIGEDDSFLDCSNNHIALAMLPRIPQAGFMHLNLPLLEVNDAMHCLAWIEGPPDAGALIAIDAARKLRNGRSGERVLLKDALEESGAWQVRRQVGTVQLWAQK